MINIILKRVERNSYDDSDYFDIYYDVKEDCIKNHLYASTRFGGDVVLPDSINFNDLNELDSMFYDIKINSCANRMAIKFLVNEGQFYEGDIVKVTNTRARKYKNEVFAISEIKTEYWNNRVSGIYAFSDNGIKTNINNISKLTPSKNSINEIKNIILTQTWRLDKYRNDFRNY